MEDDPDSQAYRNLHGAVHSRLGNYEDAVGEFERVLRGRPGDPHLWMNYGHALNAFQRNHLSSVSRRTSVIVIGDGRSNYNPPNVHVLDEIKRRCKRLLWLCPEDKAAWGFGDAQDTGSGGKGGKPLQRGITFRAVQTTHDDKARTSGRAYLYFWPGGRTELATITIRIGDSLDEGHTHAERGGVR